MRHILIFGATSSIAEHTARLFAADGDRLFLAARNDKKLDAVAEDLRVRGASAVETCVMDANSFDQHGPLIEKVLQTLGGLDVAFIAHGTLPDQQACEVSFETARRELDTNCMSVVSLLTHLGNYFEQQGKGTIAVISSVAGDRGRQSNYVYGTAKAAVSTFLQGLRNRLHPVGVHVLTIKPGFVDTPMTARFDKGLLWAKPQQVASGIYRAILKKKDVVYLPWFWRWIMLIIRLIPERVFKRLTL